MTDVRKVLSGAEDERTVFNPSPALASEQVGVEEIAQIIDPESWGLPPVIEIENLYHDRETARAKARAILARISLQEREKDAWQPIETAPKDGTAIDVWLVSDDPDEIWFYCLTKGSAGRSPSWSWRDGKFRPIGGLGAPVLIQPTHWMPLPAAPDRKEG